MADPIGQNYSVPEETSTVVINDVNPITQSVNPVGSSSATPPQGTKKPSKISGKVVATLFGLLLLVGAVGAGVALVGQQQHLGQKAANGGGCTQTATEINCPVKTDGTHYTLKRCHSNTNTGVNYPECATSDNCTTENWDGGTINVSAPSCGSNQIDVEELGGGICSGSGRICGGQCGNSCTSDADCASPSANGATVACRGGTCQNTNCVGKTVPGANCDCSTLNACGQPCSAAVGLCQSGSECGFITTASQCVGAEGNTTKQFCLPVTPNNGYTKALCSGIAASYLVNPSGQSGTPPLTQADVIAACAAQATPTPTVAPVTAQCTNIKAYDSNWNLLTNTQLSQLVAGSIVRFTVTGTTTGTFDKARFTINGAAATETTLTKPGDTSTYYLQYTIPDNTTTFEVDAQIHSTQLNQWF